MREAKNIISKVSDKLERGACEKLAQSVLLCDESLSHLKLDFKMEFSALTFADDVNPHTSHQVDPNHSTLTDFVNGLVKEGLEQHERKSTARISALESSMVDLQRHMGHLQEGLREDLSGMKDSIQREMINNRMKSDDKLNQVLTKLDGFQIGKNANPAVL